MTGRIAILTLVAVLCSCARTGVHESTAPPPTENQTEESPGVAGEPAVARVPRDATVRLSAPSTFRALLERLEPMYEAHAPGVNLVVDYGEAQPPLSAEQALVMDIDAGSTVDVFIAADGAQIEGLMNRPARIEPWLTNEIVLIRPRGSTLRLIDLSKGSCQMAVALDRSALGRATRASLRERGIWETVTARVGLFEDGAAIQTRVGDAGLAPCLGIVWRSDLWNTPERVRVIGPLAPGDEAPIEHYAASWTGQGSRLIDWLLSEEAVSAAVETGFVRIEP